MKKTGLIGGSWQTALVAGALALVAAPMLGMTSEGARPIAVNSRRAVSGVRVRGVAACPGGVITVQEEDYYGVPSKTNPSGTGVANFFANYSKTHPCVKVIRQHPVTTDDAQYLTHVLSQFSSGSQPDLLMVDNPQLPEFAADNLLVPLTSLGPLPVVRRINPANVSETTYHGKLYALPIQTNTIAIFYNKTLLKKAGITKLPTTWTAFNADAVKFAHGKFVHKDWGFVFSGQAGPGEATWQFDPWAWSNGGTLIHPAAKPSVQALSFLAKLVKEGAAPKEVANWSQTQPIQEFEAGKAAFAENGLWNIPTLDSQYPKLKWGVIKIPTRLPGQTVVAPFGGEVWAIPKTSLREEKAAFALLKDMGNHMIVFAKALAAVPTQPALWKRPPWNTQVYAPFLAELKHGRARTAGIKNPANEPAISLDIGNAIEAALVDKMSPPAAMKAAQQKIAPLLK